MSEAKLAIDIKHKDFIIPDFLIAVDDEQKAAIRAQVERRFAVKTHDERKTEWQEDAKRKEAKAKMAVIVESKLKEMRANPDALDGYSIPELAAAYNEAVKFLDRPEDVIQTFRDIDQARERIKGVIVEMDAQTSIDRTEKKARTRTGSTGKAPAKARAGAEKAPSTAKGQKKPTGAIKKAASRSAPTPAEKPPVHAGNKPLAALKEVFKTREGSNREALLVALAAKQGKQVPVKDLVTAVYETKTDAANEKARGKLGMVLKGLQVSIEKDKLPFAVHTQRVDGESSIGLYATK